MTHLPKFRAAAVHAAPVFLDKAATTEKAVSIIREAARAGAQLVAFPETYIPAFPVWAALWAPIENHDFFVRMADASILVDGPELAHIRRIARELGVFVSMGFSERSPVSVGCMWNSNVIIGDDGAILVHHRKLVPTFYEKLVWASGDGEGLRVANTSIGKIGGLICGENTNPLARFALMAQGEQVHISSWPPMWPTRHPSNRGNFDNVAANRIRASAHSFEAKAFGIVTAGFMDAAMRQELVNRDPGIASVIDGTPRAASFFVGPTGDQISETLQDEEGIVYAEIDIGLCVEPKQFHDVVGYYNRYDVFDFTVRRLRQKPAAFIDSSLSEIVEESVPRPSRTEVPVSAYGVGHYGFFDTAE